jgi:carbonic anhydrase
MISLYILGYLLVSQHVSREKRRKHHVLNASFPGVIGEMVQPIIPAVLEARRLPGGTTLDAAVVANAKRVAVRLKTQSPVVQEAVRQNRLKIVAARYDLAAGHVDWFEDI